MAHQQSAAWVRKNLYLLRKYNIAPIRIIWYLVHYYGIKISNVTASQILRRYEMDVHKYLALLALDSVKEMLEYISAMNKSRAEPFTVSETFRWLAIPKYSLDALAVHR